MLVCVCSIQNSNMGNSKVRFTLLNQTIVYYYWCQISIMYVRFVIGVQDCFTNVQFSFQWSNEIQNLFSINFSVECSTDLGPHAFIIIYFTHAQVVSQSIQSVPNSIRNNWIVAIDCEQLNCFFNCSQSF